jgi:hypothetical protein
MLNKREALNSNPRIAKHTKGSLYTTMFIQGENKCLGVGIPVSHCMFTQFIPF